MIGKLKSLTQALTPHQRVVVVVVAFTITLIGAVLLARWFARRNKQSRQVT